jgi:hypothetical protein
VAIGGINVGKHQNPFCVHKIPADLSISCSVEDEFFPTCEMN